MALDITSTNRARSRSPSPLRSNSPSPTIDPSPALLACPPLDRSFSMSSVSDFSGRSSGSRSSTGSAVSRRRGYIRPQGVSFADSAKNRDSVMSLGSIAHLQYYFARTGVLDGKGAQLARGDSKRASTMPVEHRVSIAEANEEGLGYVTGDFVNSPIEEEDTIWDDEGMLPPTVSTYSHRTQYIPPPPDSETLRRELREALGHMTKALEDVKVQKEERKEVVKQEISQERTTTPPPLEDSDGFHFTSPGHRSPQRGWHEIQGMHILDVVTLAIKAAREYYTAHENPQRLLKVKSERQIREELLGVMDILKRMATRNFAGGMKDEEIKIMNDWLVGVESFLIREKEVEDQELRDRESWRWLEGTWTKNDRQREWEFMRNFLEEGEELPVWHVPSPSTIPAQEGQYQTQIPAPTPFLSILSTGLLLCHLHNRILKKSKRQFGEIKAYNVDTKVPYRAADNLRYWIKAAEIRWEIKLQVDVMGVVYAKSYTVWEDFDRAILQWCKAVREEVTKEWKAGAIVIRSPTVASVETGFMIPMTAMCNSLLSRRRYLHERLVAIPPFVLDGF